MIFSLSTALSTGRGSMQILPRLSVDVFFKRDISHNAFISGFPGTRSQFES